MPPCHPKRPLQLRWADLSQELVRHVYSQEPLQDQGSRFRGDPVVWKPRHRVVGELVCRSWAVALRSLPFRRLILPLPGCQDWAGWVERRRPAADSLNVIAPRREVADLPQAERLVQAMATVAAASGEVLHTLCWDSGESLRLAALSLPAPTLALLVQRLQAAELSLTAGEGPPAWLHQLQSLTRLYMNWPTSSSQQPALRVPLPPSVVWAYLAEEGYAAQPRPRPLVMDLRLCPAALQYLAVQGFLSARLECSDPLAALQSLTVKLNPWARGPANLLQFAPAAQRPCPALEYLLLGLVTGAIDLHQFPSLKELELVSSPAKLSARRQLPHLTRLTAEGLWSTPTQSPALAHMSALQELAIRSVDEARIDIGCFPCLTALELDGVSSLQLMASGSRVVPGITRLECCATSVAGNFSALPALRELELPLADEQDMESVLADLPALTALTCSASAHIPKSACRELQHLCLCYGLSEVEEDKYGDEFESAGEKVADLGDDPIFISKGLRSATKLTSVTFMDARLHYSAALTRLRSARQPVIDRQGLAVLRSLPALQKIAMDGENPVGVKYELPEGLGSRVEFDYY